MSQKTIYFAHPMCDYGTEKEADIISFLTECGYCVVNPAEHQDAYASWLESPAFTGNRMKFWTNMASACDEIAFCAFDSDLEAAEAPSGYQDTSGSEFSRRPTIRIGAGVWKEVNGFFDSGKSALFVDRMIPRGQVLDATPNSTVWIGTESRITTDASLKTTIVSSRLTTKWLECFTLLTVDETRALLRASGTYNK